MKWLIYVIPALYLAACGYSIWLIFTVPDGLAGMLAYFLTWPWGFIPGWFPSGEFYWNIIMALAAFALNAAIMVLVPIFLIKLIRRSATRPGREGGA